MNNEYAKYDPRRLRDFMKGALEFIHHAPDQPALRGVSIVAYLIGASRAYRDVGDAPMYVTLNSLTDQMMLIPPTQVEQLLRDVVAEADKDPDLLDD